MLSRSEADARPVRTDANSRPSASMALFIRLSRSLRTVCMAASSRRHDGADAFSHHDALDVAQSGEVEHDDGKLVVHAQGNGGGVHNLEPLAQRLQMRD